VIPKPRKDQQGKVQGEFYPLQKAELIALRQAKLINNTAFVHLALRYENPFCDRSITVIPKEFAIRWLLPESSVYEAIGKLKESNAITIKSGKFTIEWVDSQQEENSENPEKLRDLRKNSGIPENQPPKPSPSKESSSLQTIQTYSNFIQTLSDHERGNFLNYCQEKTKNLRQEINDLEAWLAHKNKAGQNRWEVYYQSFLENRIKQPKQSEYHNAFEQWQEELRTKERLAEEMM
jgi:hypothetical protein